MKICGKCGQLFKSSINIDGITHNITRRKICAECLPLKKNKIKLCEKCGKELKSNINIEGENHNLRRRKMCIDCLPLYYNKNKMKKCLSCGKKFPTKLEYKGKIRDLYRRKYCINCMPIQERTNFRVCNKCGKKFPTKYNIQGKIKNSYSRNYCLECAPLGINSITKINRLEQMENDKLTSLQQEILIGHLLGDGGLCIGTRCINARFRIQRKLEDKDYLLWSADHFKDFTSDNGVREKARFDTRTQKTYFSITLQTNVHTIFTEYYNKWYPEGKKVVPKDLILTPRIIAVWFADDGCVQHVYNKGLHIEFSTKGFPKNDVDFLYDQLINLYGDKISLYKTSEKEQWVIMSTDTQTNKRIFRDIDSVFPPLYRKSKIWNREIIDLWDKNKIIHPNCIWCGSSNSNKRGFSKIYHKQIYTCNDCSKNYYDMPDYEILPKGLNYNSNPPNAPLLNAALDCETLVDTLDINCHADLNECASFAEVKIH